MFTWSKEDLFYVCFSQGCKHIQCPQHGAVHWTLVYMSSWRSCLLMMFWVTLSDAFDMKISRWWGMAWACCWKLDCQLPSEGLGSSQFQEDRCNYPHLRADNEMTSFPMPPWFSFRESIITANKTQVYLNCDVNKITAWAGTASGTEAVWVTQMPQTVTENSRFGFISGQAVAQQPQPILWEQQGQAGCSLS